MGPSTSTACRTKYSSLPPRRRRVLLIELHPKSEIRQLEYEKRRGLIVLSRVWTLPRLRMLDIIRQNEQLFDHEETVLKVVTKLPLADLDFDGATFSRSSRAQRPQRPVFRARARVTGELTMQPDAEESGQ